MGVSFEKEGEIYSQVSGVLGLSMVFPVPALDLT